MLIYVLLESILEMYSDASYEKTTQMYGSVKCINKLFSL